MKIRKRERNQFSYKIRISFRIFLVNSSSNPNIRRKSRASIKHFRNRRNRRERKAKERAQGSTNQTSLINDSLKNTLENTLTNVQNETLNIDRLLTPFPSPISESEHLESFSPNYSPIPDPNPLESSPFASPSYSTISSIEFLEEVPLNSPPFSQPDLENFPFLD